MWAFVEKLGAVIAVIVGIVGGLYTLIKYNKTVRTWWTEWRGKREAKKAFEAEKNEILKKLVHDAPHIVCSQIVQKEHNAQFETLDRRLGGIEGVLCTLVNDNTRQDDEISRSLSERHLMVYSLYALVDSAHQEGKNGPITKAHEQLHEYIMSKAFEPTGGTNEDRLES